MTFQKLINFSASNPNTSLVIYLEVAIVPWAILLVNQHRIANILHYYVLEMNVRSSTGVGIWPSLDSDSVLGVYESATGDEYALDRLFVGVFSKTSYADTMSRPARYLCDCYLLATVSDRDTIVAGLDVGVENFDVGRTANVDSVCVGTISWCNGFEVMERYVSASQNMDVELLAVPRGHVLDYGIGDEVKSDILSINFDFELFIIK